MCRLLIRIPACAALAIALVGERAAHAELIVAGQDIIPSIAVQTVDLFPGTPFNPGPETLTVVLTAVGSFVMDRAAQVGDSIDFTIPQALFQGTLPGPLPPLAFNLIAGGPDLNTSIGQITNVVQNPLSPGFSTGSPSSFVSGNFLADTYFRLDIPLLGATIYSDPNSAAVFAAAMNGLPAPAGTVFASPDPVALYLQIGPGFDPTRDPIIGQSYDRTVTATPEPSTLVMMAGLAVIFAARSVAGGFRFGRRAGDERTQPA